MSNKRVAKKITKPEIKLLDTEETYNDLDCPDNEPIKTLPDGRIVFTGVTKSLQINDKTEEAKAEAKEVKEVIRRNKVKTKSDDRVLEDKIDRLITVVSDLRQEIKTKDSLIADQQVVINELSKAVKCMKVSFESMEVNFENLGELLEATNRNQEKLMGKFEGQFATLVQNVIDRSPLNEVVDSLRFEIDRLILQSPPSSSSSGTVTPNTAAINKAMKKRGRPAQISKESENYKKLHDEYLRLKGYRYTCKKNIEKFAKDKNDAKVLEWTDKSLINEKQMKALKVAMDEDKQQSNPETRGTKDEENHDDNNS